jgi:hypothetical protein
MLANAGKLLTVVSNSGITGENYHKELVRGKEEAEAELENAQHTINTQNTEIRKYREFISRLRYDPDTLRKIGGPSA